MRLAVIDRDSGGPSQVERTEPSAFLCVVAAVYEYLDGRASARGRPGDSRRLLGRLGCRRGLGRWNRLALGAEVGGDAEKRRNHCGPRNDHPALQFKV